MYRKPKNVLLNWIELNRICQRYQYKPVKRFVNKSAFEHVTSTSTKLVVRLVVFARKMLVDRDGYVK